MIVAYITCLQISKIGPFNKHHLETIRFKLFFIGSNGRFLAFLNARKKRKFASVGPSLDLAISRICNSDFRRFADGSSGRCCITDEEEVAVAGDLPSLA